MLIIILSVNAYKMKKEHDELKEEVKLTVSQQKEKIETEFGKFRTNMEKDYVEFGTKMEKELERFKEHRAEIEQVISNSLWKKINETFDPPEKLKMYVLSLLSFNGGASEEFLHRVKTESGRLSGYPPTNHNHTEETEETGEDKS